MSVRVSNDYILDEDGCGEFCVIMLGKKGTSFAKIDPDDFEDIGGFFWSLGIPRKDASPYARRQYKKGEKYGTIYMHRHILRVRPGVFVDHINGNGLDNRKHNLRVATNSQNQMNSSSSVGTSRYKGVCWHKASKKWSAKLVYARKDVNLGLFPVNIVDGIDLGEIRAAKAYDRAARMHFGVFARLNFPELGDNVMSYVMTEEENKKAYQLISNCSGENLADIGSSVGDCSVEELELMCRYCECNISKLSERIKSMRPRGYTEARMEANRLGGK